MMRATIYRIGFLGIVFVTNILIANLCHPANFGTISLLTVNGAIWSLVVGMGLDSVVIYSVSHQKWTPSEAAWVVNRSSIGQLLIFLLLESAWVTIFRKTFLSSSQPAFAWAEVVFFAGLIFRDRYLALFYSRNQAQRVNGALLATGSLFLALLAVWALDTRLSFPTLYIVFCVQSFVQGLAVLALFRMRSENAVTNGLEWRKMAAAFKLCLLVLVTNMVQTVAYRVDYLFIDHFHTKFDVGIYSQANKFANLIWIVPNVIATILTPRMVNMDKDSVKLMFRTAIVLNFLTACATCVLALVFYRFVLVPQYRPGFLALLLMLPGYLFWSFVIYFGAFFASKGRFRTNFGGSLLCFCVIMLCDWMLIPGYNYKGAAIANTIAYGIGFVYYLICFLKYTQLPLKDMAAVRKGDLSRFKILVSE